MPAAAGFDFLPSLTLIHALSTNALRNALASAREESGPCGRTDSAAAKRGSDGRIALAQNRSFCAAVLSQFFH